MMNYSPVFLAIAFFVLPFSANANNFNHKGIQKGAISESCYHNPCSVVRVMKFEVLKKSPQSTLIKLNVVGGSRDWDAKKTIWNHSAHNLYVTCSIKKPTVKIDNQTTVIPLNRDPVPGVLYADTALYLQACHNFLGDETKAAKKYGYKVQDW